LIADAPNHINKAGSLRFVVQGTVPVQRWMDGVFKTAEAVADNGSFVIWEGRL